MKKFLYTTSLFSALLLAEVSFGQAKKYPLFEHFTQASCAPCAAQNPFFQAVYDANKSNMHHIAYHTSWPGVDPMYDFNPAESDEMVSYYNVTGVPDMYQNGIGIGSPANVTQETLDNILPETSPIRILVTETTVGLTRNVHVEVQTVGTVPAGTYKIKAAVAEHLVTYGTPPGTNGETDFPDVFRASITGTSGLTFTPAAVGSSVVYDWSYAIDPVYDPAEAYALVWVQNSSTKEILNSGIPGDPSIEVVNSAAETFVQGVSGTPETFGGDLINIGDANANVTLTLSADQPADWSASFTFDGGTYTTTTDGSINALATLPIVLNVNVGATSAIGEYKITVTFPDNPEIFPQVLSYYIISGVTDLVVNNQVAFGDGSPYGTYDWESMYTDGLANAGVTTFAATSHFTMKKGFNSGALDGVENIYYNVGWTFPALAGDDEKLTQLEDFLDNGGNLFISGQDIGWEVDYYAAYYPEAVSFYEDYLHATYVTDAATGATSFTAIPGDEWFGTTAASDISMPYGTTYYYPDQIEANGVDAFNIFSYNEGSKIGGVRSETSDYKTVYLGIGIEMIADEAVRNAVMDATYIYFRGLIEGIEYDNIIKGLLGSAYPNPAVNSTHIPMSNINRDYTITVSDITGKVVMQDVVKAGTTDYTLNTTELNSGMYFYFLSDGSSNTQTEKLNIIK